MRSMQRYEQETADIWGVSLETFRVSVDLVKGLENTNPWNMLFSVFAFSLPKLNTPKFINSLQFLLQKVKIL